MYDLRVRLLGFTLLLAAALAWAACGPYTPEGQDDDRARFGIATLDDCAATPDDALTPLPAITRSAATDKTVVPPAAEGCADATPSPSPELTPEHPPAQPDTPTVAPNPSPEPTIFLTPTPAPITETPMPTEPGYEQTMAVYTATARAMRSVAYLSFGDGLQWGCCQALGSSSPSIFRDYLEARIGRPVIWQTSGAGYETTDTFLNGMDGAVPQIDFAVELIEYYRREQIPVAAITMSIGGNNLVEIGLACAQPPCTDAFIAGVAHVRAQLHTIYARVASAKDATTPLLVLLYYDANECTNPSSGAAVDTWNSVIAGVATQYGARLVDARSAFRGHCDWIETNGLDANPAGHAAIAAEYRRVYESLPSELQVGP